jgi:uncharacterized DUF497 family protein
VTSRGPNNVWSWPRILIVVHAYRDTEAHIRIISARKAMPMERALYNRKARS